MKLWTIQPLLIYEKLCKDGFITGNKEYVDKDFKSSYEWLIKRMEERIGNKPNKNSYPIWAWFQYYSKNKPKPDLRRSAHLPRGVKGVRLTIEKDENEILLSDFMLWHIPLNYGGFIGRTEEEANVFERELKMKGLDVLKNDELPKYYREKIKKSWDNILDMDFDEDKALKSIQATFWKLELKEVVKTEYFIAR